MSLSNVPSEARREVSGTETAFRYWDETRDAGKFSASPVFDPKTGLGGTGKGAQHCVADGPFANLTVNIGPGFTTQPRCVNRQITDYFSYGCSKAYVDAAISGVTYEAALNAIYMGPHLNGHIALSMMVRGKPLDTAAS